VKVEELEKMKREVGEEAFTNGRFKEATELFEKLVLDDEF
jgi:malate synthase